MKKLLFIVLLMFTFVSFSYGIIEDTFWGFKLRESKDLAVQQANNYKMTLDYRSRGLAESYMYLNGDLLKVDPDLSEAIVILYFYDNKLLDLYFNFTFKSENASVNFFKKARNELSNKYGIVLENQNSTFVIKYKGLIISSLHKKEDQKYSVLLSASDNNLIKDAREQLKNELEQDEK